jgi:hypothetical protein
MKMINLSLTIQLVIGLLAVIYADDANDDLPPILNNMQIRSHNESCSACVCLSPTTCVCNRAACRPPPAHKLEKRAARAPAPAPVTPAGCLVCDCVASGDYLICRNCVPC